MARISTGELWEQGFRAAVRSGKPGWTVAAARGKINLRYRPTGGEGGEAQSVLLPLNWEKANIDRALLLINQIAKSILSGQEDSLRGALQLAQGASTTMRVGTDWEAVADSLRKTLMTGQNEILPSTWRDNYQPYIQEALRILATNKRVIDGYSLLQSTLEKWEGKPASRAACCLAIRKLTDHATARHKAANCWRIDNTSIRELRGRAPRKRTKATLEDQELISLIDAVASRNPAWGNVIRLLTLYGLRPIELQYLTARQSDNGPIAFWCAYEKNCGGSLTAPRWLFPCPLKSETGELVNWDLAGLYHAGELELPLNDKGKPCILNGHYVQKFIDREPAWQHLKEKYRAGGEWLRIYTFRDSYSLRCHRYGIEVGAVAAAMGHSLAVHSKSYRWASTDTTTEAFASAIGQAA